VSGDGASRTFRVVLIGNSELVSPAIIETLALFLTRLAQTYLFPQVSEKYELSPQLVAYAAVC
jgi:hypothetical protein